MPSSSAWPTHDPVIGWIVFAILGGPIVLLAHEGSHAVVASWRGARVTSFRPWPHMSPDGVFRFGEVRWIYGPEWRPTPVLWSSPLWADLLVGVVAILVGLLVWRPVLAVAAWNVLDVLRWLQGYFGLCSAKETRDGWRWRHNLP